MRQVPKRPNLEEIVAKAGGLRAYLNSEEQRALNNGLGYSDIMLLFDISVAAVVKKTGRAKGTIYNLKSIRDKENAKTV